MLTPFFREGRPRGSAAQWASTPSPEGLGDSCGMAAAQPTLSSHSGSRGVWQGADGWISFLGARARFEVQLPPSKYSC